MLRRTLLRFQSVKSQLQTGASGINTKSHETAPDLTASRGRDSPIEKPDASSGTPNASLRDSAATTLQNASRAAHDFKSDLQASGNMTQDRQANLDHVAGTIKMNDGKAKFQDQAIGFENEQRAKSDANRRDVMNKLEAEDQAFTEPKEIRDARRAAVEEVDAQVRQKGYSADSAARVVDADQRSQERLDHASKSTDGKDSDIGDALGGALKKAKKEAKDFFGTGGSASGKSDSHSQAQKQSGSHSQSSESHSETSKGAQRKDDHHSASKKDDHSAGKHSQGGAHAESSSSKGSTKHSDAAGGSRTSKDDSASKKSGSAGNWNEKDGPAAQAGTGRGEKAERQQPLHQTKRGEDAV